MANLSPNDRCFVKISGLYVITDSNLAGHRLAVAVEQALAGGAAILQYRQKNRQACSYFTDAEALRGMTKRHGAILIINDDPKLAREVDADGVHIGQSDTSIHSARSMLGPHKLIGVSCYNDLARARRAQQQGADYVAFGSFFGSSVKPDAVKASTDLLRQASQELRIPIVAIGGIDEKNGRVLIAAGADSLAVISAVFAQEDIKASACRLTNLFN